MINVIFDLDGTVIDSEEGIVSALKDTISELNLQVSSYEDYKKFIGPPIKKTFIEVFELSETDAEIATQLYRKKYINDYIEHTRYFEGFSELVSKLIKRGCRLHVATMKTKRQFEALIKGNNNFEHFSMIMTARDRGGYNKRDMLNDIVSNYGVNESYWLVGDTISDYKSTFQTNVKFIFAEYGYGKIAEQDSAKEYYVIKSLLDVVKYL